MKKQIYIALFFLFSGWALPSQDIFFSSPQNLGIWLNPARTGALPGKAKKDGSNSFSSPGGDFQDRFNLAYRSQWAHLEDGPAFQTALAAYDHRFCFGADQFGLGMQLWSDWAGSPSIRMSEVKLSAAYLRMMGTGRKRDWSLNIGAGFEAGFLQTQFNAGKLTFDRQFDGLDFNPGLPSGEAFIESMRNQLDLGAGLFFQWVKNKTQYTGSLRDIKPFMELGLSLRHFNLPVQRFKTDEVFLLRDFGVNNRVTWGLHGAGRGNIPGLKLFYRLEAAAWKQDRLWMGQFIVEPGLAVGDSGLLTTIGAGLRITRNDAGDLPLSDAILLKAGLQNGPYFVTVSYDYALNPMRLLPGWMGTFEAAVTYLMGSAKKECVRCPR